ncbi:hypothetical protein [Hoeflea sp.]|jgi:hypothetical protein|uniref:hypothetical protein n=1 Tax=Hoeflea sp. TaxID=1940281 RepID=UPI0019C55F78|nr:hypothetical protein [Hoeflea sp.]MBC7286005.1 hypothetical protein [Hoeflea sp.]
MANRPAQISETEIKRTVKGVLAGGFAVGCIKVDHRNGTVTIFPEGAPESDQATSNPCDRLLK